MIAYNNNIKELTKSLSMPAQESVSSKIKVIIADDHRLFRTGIMMVMKGINIISQIKEAENGKEVLEILEQEYFDVVMMDISMPVMNGILTTKEIFRRFPKTRIIALSMYEDEQHMMDMFHNGAMGYLFKNTEMEEIKNALIEVVYNGRYYWPKEMNSKMFNKVILKRRDRNNSYNALFSNREKEILSLICREFSSKEIADHLHLSQKTIAWHRENLMQKSQTKNTAGLVVFALKHELA